LQIRGKGGAMKYWALIVLVLTVSGLGFSESSFDEIVRNGKQKSEDFHDFKKIGERRPYDMTPADLTGACVFVHTTSPGVDVPPPTDGQKFVVSSPEDVLEACKDIPDDSCKGGVALNGHAQYNMGTWSILYLDSTSSVTDPKFYPPEKEVREKLVACFKRISKGIRTGDIPLTFVSCTHPYPEDPKKWDQFSHLLSKEIGLKTRTARGDGYTLSARKPGVAQYGWSWSTPDDPQVHCEDGVCWSWKVPKTH
jgi:hypothetical protein